MRGNIAGAAVRAVQRELDMQRAINAYCRGCPCWLDRADCYGGCPLQPYMPQHVEKKKD